MTQSSGELDIDRQFQAWLQNHRFIPPSWMAMRSTCGSPGRSSLIDVAQKGLPNKRLKLAAPVVCGRIAFVIIQLGAAA